jgi:hypothetical protein
MTFRLTRWAAAVAVLLTVAAMVCYPGGTWRDRSGSGYSMTENSLSDLGARFAWNGRVNSTSAVLFGTGLCLAAAGGVACFVALIPLYSSSRATRWLSRLAGASGAVACLGLCAAALVAEDRNPALHGLLSFGTGTAMLGMLLLFAVATTVSEHMPRAVPVVWWALGALLGAWLAVARHRPAAATAIALAMVLQKVVAVVIVLAVIGQSYFGQRSADSRVRAV